MDARDRAPYLGVVLMRLVLASTSQYRRALLDAAGIRYEAVSPPFVEEHGHAREPSELVVELARGKAESLAAQLPDALILGADQIPAVDGRVLTKPGSRDAAIEQLRALSGREHRLFTAVAVHEPASGRTLTRTVIHVMRMRALTEAQLAAYVDRDQPFDCAGAYKVEAAGALLFEAMEGVDHTAIVGLPLTAVAELLLAFGHDVLG